MGFYSLNRGKSAEKFAFLYLKKSGYKILEKNYRSRFGEIDLIGIEGSVLCFVEVKYRKNTDYGSPEDFVDSKKQRKIIKTAFHYILENRIEDKNIRFDIVSIKSDADGKFNARLIRNGFEADYYDKW